MSSDWVKVKAQKASEVAADIDLEAESGALMKPAFTPGAFFLALRSAERRIDAARFLARALPPTDAVAWACWCVAKTLAPDAPQSHHDAISAARAWLSKPTEASARAAWKHAEALKFGVAAAWCAAAPLWSMDNFAPEGAPPVKPPAHLPSRAVTGAVLLAAAVDPARVDALQDEFLDQGARIAAGAQPVAV